MTKSVDCGATWRDNGAKLRCRGAISRDSVTTWSDSGAKLGGFVATNLFVVVKWRDRVTNVGRGVTISRVNGARGCEIVTM